jgi:hypothetical protein
MTTRAVAPKLLLPKPKGRPVASVPENSLYYGDNLDVLRRYTPPTRYLTLPLCQRLT